MYIWLEVPTEALRKFKIRSEINPGMLGIHERKIARENHLTSTSLCDL